MESAKKREKRIVRKRRIRAKLSGTKDRPRLAVFRSNRFIEVQLIDDSAGKTLAHASDNKAKGGKKVEKAAKVGTEIAGLASKLGVKTVLFDRGGYIYTGRVRALADAARAAGLKF